MSRAGVPSALERKCLAHLDHAENWRLLSRERPGEDEAQPWGPFRRIFAINLVQYALVLALVLAGLEASSGATPADVREDLPVGAALVGAVAGALALYTAHLYRRSWNRRAAAIRRARGREGSFRRTVMSEERATEANKRLLRRFIEIVWTQGRIDALPEFWTADAVNHAAPNGHRNGLDALRAYHEGFAQALRAFSDFTIRIERQVAEGDLVTTHLVSTGTQTGEFQGIAPTGRRATLESMRIDRIEGRKIAEHWSVGDTMGFLAQLRG